MTYKLYDKKGIYIDTIEVTEEAVKKLAEEIDCTYVEVLSPEVIFQRIAELKQKLAETDYIAAKIAEGAATHEEYADMIAQRQAWRDEINELQKELINNGT